MKVYQVSGHMGNMVIYYEPTLAEAQQLVRTLRKDGYRQCEITQLDFPPCRRGLAQAMNFVMHLTCFNEA